MPRSHENYGQTHTCVWSVGCPYEIEPLAIFWSHTNGWCTGFYGVSTVSRRRLPYGACTGPYGACASTVRTRTCLRTPVEFYDHCTWPVRVPVMAVSAHTSSWPRTTAYVPSTGEKRCTCTTFRHGLLTGIRAEKKTVEIGAGPHGMPYDHPRVTGILALTVPVNYQGSPCDLGINK